jgi:hypothetical protein
MAVAVMTYGPTLRADLLRAHAAAASPVLHDELRLGQRASPCRHGPYVLPVCVTPNASATGFTPPSLAALRRPPAVYGSLPLPPRAANQRPRAGPSTPTQAEPDVDLGAPRCGLKSSVTGPA